jgi:YVTN family beta-propeller protein
MGFIVAPGDDKAYVSLGRAASVAVLDVAGRKLDHIIDSVGMRPWGLTLSPDGRTLYTANGPSSDVSVIDVATGKVERRINTGGSPWGVVAVMSSSVP